MKKNTILFIIILYCIPLMGLAEKQDVSLGAVAANLLEPVSLLSNFISSACMILGGSFLFASIIKYVEHRRSPLMVPISSVIFLVIAGIVLILLPFLYLLTGYGVPFSLVQS